MFVLNTLPRRLGVDRVACAPSEYGCGPRTAGALGIAGFATRTHR